MSGNVHSHRRSAHDSGTHWISYSDMMASLLLVFILAITLCIYNYHQLNETRQRELDEQQAQLTAAQLILLQQEQDLEATRTSLQGKEDELAAIQIQLDTQQQDLYAAQIALSERESENQLLLAQISIKESELDSKQDELESYKLRLSNMLGVRTRIVEELSGALSAARISATVDPNTGDIMLQSSLMFQTNSSNLKEEGQAELERLIPVYLSVLLSEQYSDYVAEIIIEGHTDSTGSYQANLRLSQSRALNVVEYCLNMPSLSPAMKLKLQNVITAQGRSESDLIYNEDGTENQDASRRVEIKFRLKDTEMIQEMNNILANLG